MDTIATKLGKKKKVVDKTEWAREKNKRLRIAGKQYTNSKGQVIEERKPGPDCKCRRKCYTKINPQTRDRLFKAYYSLKSHDEQNAYLFGLIRKVPIAQKRAENSVRRTCTFQYYIRVNGQETQVCLTALENIHGVGRRKIHNLCEKLGQNVLFPRDERGHHFRTLKVDDETIELAKNHIYSIIRTERAKEFLKNEKANNGPDVYITQMHKDFLDTYDPEFAPSLAEYEKIHGGGESAPAGQQQPRLAQFQETSASWIFNYDNAGQPIQPAHHQIVTPTTSTRQQISNTDQPRPVQKKKKRKTNKNGRPEPIIGDRFYRKIFHELYTTKEANALRKRATEWKCSGDFVGAKTMRRTQKAKTSPSPVRQTKKKPAQAPGTSSSDMYSLYPKILQDLTRLESHALPIPHLQGQPSFGNDQRNYRPLV